MGQRRASAGAKYRRRADAEPSLGQCLQTGYSVSMETRCLGATAVVNNVWGKHVQASVCDTLPQPAIAEHSSAAVENDVARGKKHFTLAAGRRFDLVRSALPLHFTINFNSLRRLSGHLERLVTLKWLLRVVSYLRPLASSTSVGQSGGG
ncbi:hypothetical protein SKAU_G00289900 [Synaphobranchus kaupii]|uniref:Uncharacterized protein n=1 Tax=Synaphobranchus kaupii TaxID=118154 RepID=A0A9Q1ETH9_SYNKA|nr:hypothetical protein SKAU_G00289900 [Synaphobranchus kaupii]